MTLETSQPQILWLNEMFKVGQEKQVLGYAGTEWLMFRFLPLNSYPESAMLSAGLAH